MMPWILSMLLLLAPPGVSTSTFPETAQAIDRAAHDRPVVDGDVAATAALLIAIARYESVFNPTAVGTDSFGTSLGLYQIHETNLRRLGIDGFWEVFDPYLSTVGALTLVAESFRVCRGKPQLHRLAMYASGRAQCDAPAGIDASVRRMRLAEEILKHHPPRWVEYEKL